MSKIKCTFALAIMAEPLSIYQSTETSPKASELIKSFSGMLVSIGHVVQEKEEQYEQKLTCLQSNQLPTFRNIIASGKRKEVIAIINAMYEAGLLDNTITKAELFERMAVVFGDPGLKEYATALSQIMQTYKYEGIFDNLAEVAKQQRDNSDKK